MKNRRIAIIAFVLVAVMAIGIGYATLNDELTIKSSAKASANTVEFDGEIKFTEAAAVVENGASNAGIATISADGDTVTIAPTAEAKEFQTLNDTVTVTITLTSTADVDAYIKSINIENGDTEYFDVTVTGITSNAKLEAGKTLTFVVTIDLIKTPTTVVETSFDISFVAGTTAESVTP